MASTDRRGPAQADAACDTSSGLREIHGALAEPLGNRPRSPYPGLFTKDT
jgi:hypothetical protein